MPTKAPTRLLSARYRKAAQEYLRKLPLEHFAESTGQSKQREITLESLDLVAARRSDFQVFNELLVQYPIPRRERLGQVVPDNMIVIHPAPIVADLSFDLPLQPALPYWVLDYVVNSNRRKDYDDNMRMYEHDLKVPYYARFALDNDEMTLYRHTGKRYVPVPPDQNGRCAVEELDIEIGLTNDSFRFWHRGEMLPLPGELLRELESARSALNDAKRKLQELTRRTQAAKRELAEFEARDKI